MAGKKRKWDDRGAEKKNKNEKVIPKQLIEPEQKNNLAKRNRIIAKKRTMRKSRKAG